MKNKKARDVALVFEEIAPPDTGIPGDQLSFIHGDPGAAVAGVGCMWCVHVESLRYCAVHKLNMIICHEALFLPAQKSPWYDGPGEDLIFSNRIRREELSRSGAVVYRSHSNWDALRNFGTPDSAVAALGLKNAKEVGRQKFFSVHELARAMPVEELKRRVEKRLGFPQCRIFGDAGEKIRRFAFLIGGFGENQYHMPQAAFEMGAEAVIIGEMSEFIVIACLEMGMPVIESMHSASEIPGIRRQAELLAKRLHPLRVEYVPSGAASFFFPQYIRRLKKVAVF